MRSTFKEIIPNRFHMILAGAIALATLMSGACGSEDSSSSPSAAPTATRQAAPAPTITLTITPTAAPATPTPEPTATPSVIDVALSDIPAEHTDEQIARSVEAVNQAAWNTLLADSGLDLEAVRGLNIKQCQRESDEELIETSEVLRTRFGDFELTTTVLGVERLDDNRAWTTGQLEIGNSVVAEVPPSLVAFEDGQWRAAECLLENDPSLQPPADIEPGPWAS